METRRLEAFVALVDAGGFRQAADELFITQPALSQQIARLEKDVGVQLIDRTTRPITTTEAGREFYFRCRNVLDSMREISQLLEDAREAHFGRVRIGVVPAMLFASPARAIRSFQSHFPEAEVLVRSLATSTLIEELEQGSVDVAVLLTRPDLKDVSAVDLFSEDYMVCLPSGHPLEAYDEVSFGQLRGERLIQGPRAANPMGFDSVVAACMNAGFSPRSVNAYGSYLDHAGLVSAGMGVSFAPESFEAIQPNGVVYRKLVKPRASMTASVSWYPRRLDSVGRAFVEHCIAECTSGG
ncbi:LysR family transcriptional regulator [Leucobacter manosquensis]|uniref:LysR family transcriptional regulator n=1 Tax=Leucobacter manosquensis TaxID=2810611 RepID=A0ABS5M7J8_9MICO|nr:LysR family transcriptional regulator [Leucobacter manosquensis]MBS3182945.1 LysR family transcriptional regulator [Leucobacter manosquensis]